MAQTADSSLNALLPYVNLGLAGIFLGLFITGKIVPGARYDKLEMKFEKLEDYNKDELIPLVVNMSGALTENTKLLADLKSERDRYIEQLQRRDRQSQGAGHGRSPAHDEGV